MLYVTTFTHNLTQKKTPLTLLHISGDFCVRVLTSRSFLHDAQSLNCAHNGLKEQLLTYQLQDCEPRCLVKKPLWCRWQPAPSVDVYSTAQVDSLVQVHVWSALVLPEGLWPGCASTAGAFCTLNSCFSPTLQVCDYVRDCRFEPSNIFFSASLFTVQKHSDVKTSSLYIYIFSVFI